MTGRRKGPPAGIDILADLAHAAKVQRRAARQRRWTNGEAEVYKAKIARTKARKIREKRKGLPPKHPHRAPVGLSIAERVLLAMLPGEWLTSVDIAQRSGLTPKQAAIKLRQVLAWNGFVISVLDPDRPSPTLAWERRPVHHMLHTLTLFGCAARQSRVALAEKFGMPPTIVPPASWKIPGKFLESFQIDFSPFFRSSRFTGDERIRAQALPAARAAWAAELAAGAAAALSGEPLPGALPDVLAHGIPDPTQRKAPRAALALPGAAVQALFPYRGGPYRKTAAGGASEGQQDGNEKRPHHWRGRSSKSRDPV